MSAKKEKADLPEPIYLFEDIDDPRQKFGGSYSEAYDEVVWRSFQVLFQRGRIENASTRELNMLLGTSVDKIQDLALTRLPDDAGARLERHRRAQEKLQNFQRDYGLNRAEALAFLKEEAPLIYELILSPGEDSTTIS